MDIDGIDKCIANLLKIESISQDLKFCNYKELIESGLSMIYKTAQETEELLDYYKNEKIGE